AAASPAGRRARIACAEGRPTRGWGAPPHAGSHARVLSVLIPPYGARPAHMTPPPTLPAHGSTRLTTRRVARPPHRPDLGCAPGRWLAAGGSSCSRRSSFSPCPSSWRWSRAPLLRLAHGRGGSR